MELITTHVGADFDALASALAARRLHPEGRLFFPGSREESVRRMLDTGLVEFAELRQKDIDPAALDRVVLCDTRQRDRLGVVGEWLQARPQVEVIAYDHHPDSPTDLPVGGGLVDAAVGSTSTLMVEEFRRRGFQTTASEATVLLLGIYEDTGSLTYPTTHARDLEAAAWLLAEGAELQAVRRFALRQLDALRLDVLHRMTQALEVRRIRGHRVGLVALELGQYIDELAPLVSRCLELYDLALLFAFFGERDRLTVIARGEVAGFDLGVCLAQFAGGGGHPTAAAASLKDSTALEARERLLHHLGSALPPAARASDLMISGFYALPAATTVERAKAQLNEWRVNAAPVVGEEGGPVVGVITRQTLDAALQHGLGGRPVETVASRDVLWVEPTAPAEEVGRLMVAPHPRLVLVGDRAAGRAEGIVTRMALLRHLHGRLEGAADPAERRARDQRAERQRVTKLLEERLPPALRERLRVVAKVAGEHGIPVYLVGGFVRDLLLGRENRDLDLVVEGDGPHFARLLAAALGGRVREHRAFLTAVVVDREGEHLDVASARSEFYRAPAALPEVQTSALRQDLYRRDFTINTLAIRLGRGEPELVDYFGARRDLEERTLRVLHSLSLIDDPTRVLRAVRLEVRLGFRISPETLRLVQVALAEGVFERLSGARLREELIELLAEPAAAVRALERLAELRLLPVLHPRLALDGGTRERLARAVAVHDWFRLAGLRSPRVEPWRLMLLALAADLERGERERLADRLHLAGDPRRLLVEFRERVEEARSALRAPGVLPHAVSARLAGLTGEELLLAMAEEDEPGRTWLRRELLEFRPLVLRVRGADLVARGFAPGPRIGEALAATREARLDGRIAAAGELEYALAELRRRSASGAPAAVGRS